MTQSLMTTAAWLAGVVWFSLPAVAGDVRLRFERTRIGTVTYEAASAFDVDKDGAIDIVSGEYWFAGPDYLKKHKICELRREMDYYDDFSACPMDVNGDGYMDIISGGWWGSTLQWRENPKGKPVPWPTHDIDKTSNIETTRCWDVDKDGHEDIVPNEGGRVTVYRLLRDAAGKGTAKFQKTVIKESGCGHGLGFGDVNGDGRGDFLVPEGWLEAPADPWTGKWTWHGEFNFGSASIPLLVHDVNEDGKPDVIVGQGHDYGLDWYEQRSDAAGKREWIKHPIDPHRSQYHDMILYDIDKDGTVELITGKRYRAHGTDPGAEDPVGLYYFEIDKGAFRRHTLDYGPAARCSAAGINFFISDVDGNGWSDIIAPGKEGLYLFRNFGPFELGK